MEIYLKQKEKIVKEDKVDSLSVTVKDLCDTIVFDNKINNIVVFNIPKGEFKRYVLTSIQITEKILEYNRDLSLNFMGMTETIVEYKEAVKKHTILDKLKITLVCLIIFAGASSTIMSFHNETDIPSVFDQYYKIFFGYESNNKYFVDIPYSIGLSLGIILFFNHIFGKKITDSPTPIEVEMMKYESDLAKTEAKIEENKEREAKK